MRKRVGRQVAILGEPSRKCARRYVDAKTLLDALSSALARLAAVVEHQRFEHDLQRIGLALRALRRENAVAGTAVPELYGFEFLVALAFTW